MAADVIAIDGPAASGKSTIASKISERLGVPYVSTGAMYRAVAWKALSAGLDISKIDERSIAPVLERLDLGYGPGPDGKMALKVDGRFPDEELRTPEVSAAVSHVAALPNVRAAMGRVQRALAGKGTIVMEGRDIGTCVFPDARIKFFLTASPLVRAKRRLAQGGEAPDGATVEAVAADIAALDETDSKRPIAPLKQAEDAILIDSSEFSVEQTLAAILSHIQRRS